MTIKELTIGKIKLRLTDPARSSVYGELLNDIKLRAKTAQIEPKDSDIAAAAKRLCKTLVEAIKVVEGELLKQYEAQIKIVEELVPQKASIEDVTAFIETYLIDNPDLTIKQMGLVMKDLKGKFGESLDGKEASAILKAKLN